MGILSRAGKPTFGGRVDEDTRGYVGDLIRTAEDHLDRARALLHEAAILLDPTSREAQ